MRSATARGGVVGGDRNCGVVVYISSHGVKARPPIITMNEITVASTSPMTPLYPSATLTRLASSTPPALRFWITEVKLLERLPFPLAKYMPT